MTVLLIVEDELETRNGLKKHIPWKELGVDVIEEASNGLAAIEVCRRIRPDILLTDVRMPQMGGIELAAYVHEHFEDCRIIFLSGFSDKEYLKQAIHLGAISYIEKPINKDEVIAAVSRAMGMHAQAEKKRNDEQRLQDMLAQNLPLRRQRLALDCIDQNKLPGLKKNMEKLLPLSYTKAVAFTVLLVRAEFPGQISTEEAASCKKSLLHSFDAMEGEIQALAAWTEDNLLLLHCSRFVSEDSKDSLAYLEQLKLLMARNCPAGTAFTIAIGSPVASLSGLSGSYLAAARAYKRRFFNNRGQLLYPSSVRPGSFLMSDSRYEEFSRCLDSSRNTEALNYLDKIYQDILPLEETDSLSIRDIYFHHYLILSGLSQNKGISMEKNLRESSYFWKNLLNMDTLFEIHASILEQVKNFYDIVELKEQNGRGITAAIQYIRDNYADTSLSVKSIAEYLHYDHYYLCTLFKKITGTTLNDFITETRLNKAKELMRKREIKSYEIAGMIGYSDPSYFARVFKKHTGKTPSEYRETSFL